MQAPLPTCEALQRQGMHCKPVPCRARRGQIHTTSNGTQLFTITKLLRVNCSARQPTSGSIAGAEAAARKPPPIIHYAAQDCSSAICGAR